MEFGINENKGEKILIVRPDGIGDFVIFSAVLEHYAELYNDYKIDLLCLPQTKELVRSIPFIDKIICINTRKLYRKKYFLYTVLSILKVKRFKYEKIIYPVYSRTKHDDLLIKFIRAKEKIAFDGNSSNDPNNERIGRNRYFTRIIESEKGEKVEIERNAEFVNKLGGRVDTFTLKPKIWFSDGDDIKYERLREKYNFSKNDYIAIFPGAGSQIRCWESDKWAELIKRIFTKSPKYKIVILGYGNDIFAINGILDVLGYNYNERVINLYKKTTLKILAKVIQGAKLFIGTESGAIHIAAAVGTPNVCLMGGGHFGRFYPYGDLNKNRIVYKKMDCFGCNWKCKYKTSKCIKEIEVEDVWREIEKLT